jgi:hypothetical protein
MTATQLLLAPELLAEVREASVGQAVRGAMTATSRVRSPS